MNLLEQLAIPIVQAPMFNASTQAMAVAVSKAGGLGQFAAAGSPPDQIETVVAELKRDADAPFGVNLLMVQPVAPDGSEVAAALERLRPWYEARGLALPPPPNRFAHDFEAQLAAVVRAAPPAASFAFSILTAEQVGALHAAGVFVIGTATTVAEARAWEAVGADAVCAQGMEAGGHRGHFLKPVEESLTGTLALVAATRAAVAIPVIAAGGIMDGRGVAAALALGAAAAQMGTAFLLSDESAISPAWRREIEAVGDDATTLTDAFSGRHARGIVNAFIREMRGVPVPPYPVQNRLTQPLRAAAAAADDASALSLWAGQAVQLATPGRAGDLVRQWWTEAKAVAAELAERTGR
ncbi:MAG TPA: nitronate monooxygenase [Caulobacteraceae bacterium]|nr:nitronate monooxygenase [Caulobacteraceae bacterium]